MKPHNHELSGYSVITQRGPQLRWCARCGAVGVYAIVPGRKPHLIGWVKPGPKAEEELTETINDAVKHTKRVRALPQGRRIDSPDGGIPTGPRGAATRGLEEVFEHNASGVDLQ